jgi:hypothetical protein
LKKPISPAALKSFFSSFFWLDPKEPKGQDTAKLLPHKAGRWPAAVSAHAPITSEFCGQKSIQKKTNGFF